MREPNFSESQLQQAANTAFIRRVVEQHGVWSFAHVPSLIAEFDLGWDTAFFLPWLPHSPSVGDEGCNFFVQYKLSGELTSTGAKEWPTWSSPYLRFKIPHSTKSPAGAFIDDYHQWDRLKLLAGKNYPTFYATNATLHKSDLQTHLAAGTLLNHIPLLDVRTVTGLHKHVTFTSASSGFALHSEKEEVPKLTFAQGLAKVANSEQMSLRNSIERLATSLRELPIREEGWSTDLTRLLDRRADGTPREVQDWRQYLQLTYFVRQHLGAHLLWLPKDA
jgi:hypothetical protein